VCVRVSLARRECPQTALASPVGLTGRKTDSEWVMKVKERVLVESCAEGRAKGSEYRMPVLDAGS
jgi:hypothetical protein